MYGKFLRTMQWEDEGKAEPSMFLVHTVVLNETSSSAPHLFHHANVITACNSPREQGELFLFTVMLSFCEISSQGPN